MKRKVILHCEGCGETWEGDVRMVGLKCNTPRAYGYEHKVRFATEEEAQAYCDEIDELIADCRITPEEAGR